MSDPTHSARDTNASGSHYQPSLSVVFIIVVAFIGATFLMVRAASPSTGSTTTTTSSAGTTTTVPHSNVPKSKVRVQVANSTQKAGLAGHYTQILMTQDWDTLPAGNAPTPVSATVVYYNPGFKSEALEIAATIKVSASAVKPMTGDPIAGYATDDVVVDLGPNSAIG